MPYDEKRFHHYVDPAPVFSAAAAAATGLDINRNHYSADLLATLDAIVAQPGIRVVACVERFIAAELGRGFHEVRLTTDDDNDAKQWMSGASWHHYALTEANHRQWQQNRTVISKQNILPAAPAPSSHGGGGGSNRFRIYYRGNRSPHSETRQQQQQQEVSPPLEAVHVRRFNLAYIGCLPNLKARFYREIMVRERLARMRLPGICAYLGCIVENGLVVGVALQGPLLALDEALGGGFGGIPCRDIVSTSLVHATIAMQCAAGMALRGPVRPSAVMVERRSRSLVLADIDCLFAGPPGMLFGDLSARGLDAAVRPAVLLKSSLGHIFVRMCSRVLVETGGAREPREIAMACRRPVCQHCPLTSALLNTRDAAV
ncbi:hypothetical protein IWW48_002796 [Coemansia sp. RSA 1200]|nr:hypothetical protein IWW48_002796 [Coemansia sp. RSA 1200]